MCVVVARSSKSSGSSVYCKGNRCGTVVVSLLSRGIVFFVLVLFLYGLGLGVKEKTSDQLSLDKVRVSQVCFVTVT